MLPPRLALLLVFLTAVKPIQERRGLDCREGWMSRMEIIYFTVVAIGLYFLSDAILDWIERRRGTRFEQRTMVFFVIILILSLITFRLMSVLLGRG